MADKVEKTISTRQAASMLNNIGGLLAAAYPDAGKELFSKDPGLKIIQKAVLYNRIVGQASLRSGEKTAENDRLYASIAKPIIDGTDPLVSFLKGKKASEQAALLTELIRGNGRPAVFEEMVIAAAEKKAASELEYKKAGYSADGKQPEGNAAEDKPDTGASGTEGIEKAAIRMSAERLNAESRLLNSLAGSLDKTPYEFLSNQENLSAVRRQLAVELHQSQIEFELAELKRAVSHDSPDKREELLKSRAPFAFEQASAADLEAHLAKLEQSPQVAQQLQRLAQMKSIDEFSSFIAAPARMEPFRSHDSLSLFETKYIPDAITRFKTTVGKDNISSSLLKRLDKLSAVNGSGFPAAPSAEDCSGRIAEYKDVLDNIRDWDPVRDTDAGKELAEALRGEVSRLEDITLNVDREAIDFNFRADMLIDYVDPKDPARTPMDAIEAREKLIRGIALEQISFADNDFVGTVQEIHYDKGTGKIIKGPEKLITRAVDLSDVTGKKPELQLEELRKIKDVLSKSDAFYAKNSESYKKTLDCLNKVIKAHELLKEDANIRQVAKLRTLYAELDSSAAEYVSKKDDPLKNSNERGQFRLDAIRSLRSLTGEKHTNLITGRLFTEQAKYQKQMKQLRPYQCLISKWDKAGVPSDPKTMAEFKKDFDTLSSKISSLKERNDTLYLKMGLEEALGRFIEKADKAQAQNKDKDLKLDEGSLESLKSYMKECDQASKTLYAMDGTIVPGTVKKSADKVKEAPVKENGAKVF